MKSEEKLSIVIPAYNVEDYVETAVLSVADQAYKNIEIIVVDDGSTDGTGRICDRLADADNRVKVIHQSNKGVMASRLRGLREASGKWITFVDADDLINPGMYSSMLSCSDNIDLVTGGVLREEKNDVRIIYDDFEEGIYEKDMLAGLLKKAIYDFDNDSSQRLTPWLVNKVFVRELMLEVASECNDTNIAYAEDSVMLYRYMLKCRSIRILKKVYYRYRYRKGSAIHKKKEDILVDINKVYLSLKDVFEKTNKELELPGQLQKWIVCMTGYAFNHQMGFDKSICPTEFLLDPIALKKEKVALYGAGKCGCDYYRQLLLSGKVPTIWVDKNYGLYKKNKYRVYEPEVLRDVDFEIVIIAISRKEIAEEIKKELICMGIQEDMIHWRKPVRVF